MRHRKLEGKKNGHKSAQTRPLVCDVRVWPAGNSKSFNNESDDLTCKLLDGFSHCAKTIFSRSIFPPLHLFDREQQKHPKASKSIHILHMQVLAYGLWLMSFLLYLISSYDVNLLQKTVLWSIPIDLSNMSRAMCLGSTAWRQDFKNCLKRFNSVPLWRDSLPKGLAAWTSPPETVQSRSISKSDGICYERVYDYEYEYDSHCRQCNFESILYHRCHWPIRSHSFRQAMTGSRYTISI